MEQIRQTIFNGTPYLLGSSAEDLYKYKGKELTCSWNDLQQMCVDNNFDDIQIKDYKIVELLDGQVVHMEIAGINTYTDIGDIAIKPHIDFISKDVLKDITAWSNTGSNNGNDTDICPYMISDLKDFLDTIILPKIPDEISNIIITKHTLLEGRYNGAPLEILEEPVQLVSLYAEGDILSSTTWAWKDIGKLWVPSEFEVFGAQIWTTPGFGAGAAIQYPLFRYEPTAKIKVHDTTGEAHGWWLSSVANNSSTEACMVTNTGVSSIRQVAAATGYFPLCFRVGQSIE